MAGVFRGAINSRSDAVSGGVVPDASIIRPIPDFMRFINKEVIDAPLMRLVGKGAPYDQLKLEFGISDYAPITDKANGSLTNSATTIAVDTGNAFQLYDKIIVSQVADVDPLEDDEQFLVTAISGNNLTVTGGFAGTTRTTHPDNANILILGPAVPENVDTPRSPILDGTLDYNYPNEFGYSFQISGRARNTPTAEIRGDQYEDRLQTKMKEAARDLDLTMLRGKRAVGDGTTTNPSAMGGLLQFTNYYVTDANSTALSLQMINTLAQRVALDVGDEAMGKTIMGHITMKRIFNSLIDERKMATTTDEALKVTYTTFETDFGTFKFVVNNRMPVDTIIGWNPEHVKLRPYTGRGGGGGGDWEDTPLAVSGRYDIGALWGDFHLDCRFERARWKIKKIDTTLASYNNVI